ncbi:MAG: DUF3726 domain-containing protein [Rhodospirillales bacterium]
MNGPAKTPPLSLSEMAFYITRAAVGAGAPWGAAEDLARAAQAMARRNEDPAPHIARALTLLAGGESAARAVLSGTDTDAEIAAEGAEGAGGGTEGAGGALSAVCAGGAVRDWLLEHAGDEGARLRVRGADVPRLIEAAAETLPENVRAVWAAETPSPEEICFVRRAATATPVSSSAPVSPSAPAPASTPTRKTAPGGVPVDAAAWETIQIFFRRCLAPSTEASRLGGAGAGVNDTD